MWRNAEKMNIPTADSGADASEGPKQEEIRLWVNAAQLPRAWIVRQPSLIAALHELSGKNLVCWCAPQRCHAEVLIELANRRQLIAIRGGSLCRLPLASRLTESLRTRHRPSQHPV